ncbi:MAG: DUF899 family protein, partial [Thermoanaerobaculia bacterium]
GCIIALVPVCLNDGFDVHLRPRHNSMRRPARPDSARAPRAAMGAHRDVTLLALSRAPLADIDRFRSRLGWQFKWASSHGTDFNHDCGVTFTPEELAGARSTRTALLLVCVTYAYSNFL